MAVEIDTIRYGKDDIDEDLQSVWIEFDMSKTPNVGTIIIEFEGDVGNVPALWTELTKTVKQALRFEPQE